MKQKVLNQIKKRRSVRVRAKIKGTASRPRLSVFRSNKFIYAQLIDDDARKTLASVKKAKGKGSEAAGAELAKKAMNMGIKQAVFDKGPYQYHGRVKALCEEAKKSGLKI